MSTSTRPDVRICPECPQTFRSRSALRRHEVLDHRAAPDGTWLTTQLVGPAPSGDDTGEIQPADASVPPPTPAPEAPSAVPGATGVRWLIVMALLALAVLMVALGPVGALALCSLAWGYWARWQLRRSLYGRATRNPHRKDRRSPAA